MVTWPPGWLITQVAGAVPGGAGEVAGGPVGLGLRVRLEARRGPARRLGLVALFAGADVDGHGAGRGFAGLAERDGGEVAGAERRAVSR